MERVTRTLSLVRNAKPVQSETTHRQFQERRSRLNAHDALMHTVCERVGKTIYEIQGALLRLPKEAQTSVRWRGPELAHMTTMEAEKIRDLLRDDHSVRQSLHAGGYLCLDRGHFPQRTASAECDRSGPEASL